MANPLIPKKPKKLKFVEGNKSAGILDDFAVRKNVATREGTVEKTPVNNSDIANKKYVDDELDAKIEDGTAQGQFAFWNGTTSCWNHTETSELFWDDTNNRLGIGTASPATKLHIEASSPKVTVKATGAGGSNNVGYVINNEGTEYGSLTYSESSDILLLTAGNSDLGLYASDAMKLYVYSGGWIPGIHIGATGKVGIMTVAPGRELDVTGSIRASSTIEANGDIYADDEFLIRDGSHYIYSRQRGYPDDGWHIALGEDDNYGNRNMIITITANKDKDHDHDTLSTNPTLFIHSATDPDTDNTQWISFEHDQTDANIVTGTGDLYLNPAGNVKCKNGWSGTFTNGDGDTVTVSGGIITDVS